MYKKRIKNVMMHHVLDPKPEKIFATTRWLPFSELSKRNRLSSAVSTTTASIFFILVATATASQPYWSGYEIPI